MWVVSNDEDKIGSLFHDLLMDDSWEEYRMEGISTERLVGGS